MVVDTDPKGIQKKKTLYWTLSHPSRPQPWDQNAPLTTTTNPPNDAMLALVEKPPSRPTAICILSFPAPHPSIILPPLIS